MAEIGWTEEAQRWLTDIFEYIAADNPQAAARTVQGIYDRVQDPEEISRDRFSLHRFNASHPSTAVRALSNRVPHQGRRQHRRPGRLPRSARHHEVSTLMTHNTAVLPDAAAGASFNQRQRSPRRKHPR